jgi:uncharacterized protein involved in exopolysaccharide biosynthesis
MTTMNKTPMVTQFLYRIRYWVVFPPLIVTILVAFFTARLPKNYEANSTIYTGIASSPNLDGSLVANYFVTNSSFDNIINLARSRSTLESVSLKLLAQALIYGNPNTDNTYILASNYRKLREIVPADVMGLVDKTSIETTYQRFANYKKEGKNNFIYGLLNWFHPHYSMDALKKIRVNRLGSSDMIEIKYSCDDPGIVHQTLRFLIEEIDKEYAQLQLGSSSDVVAYFEKQLVETRSGLNLLEDSLLQYSVASNVINYDEQTKRLTEIKRDLDAQYENAYTTNYASGYLVKQLEQQMTERAKLLKESKDFLQQMETSSVLSQKIAELETSTNPSVKDKETLKRYTGLLDKAENRLKEISSNIATIKSSKEGLALQDMVNQWLTEKMSYDRTYAELQVLNRRMKDVDEEFTRFTPIGPNLKKQEREIQVTENAYQTILNHLAQAKLQQKNVEMKSTTIDVVTEPVYPLAAVGSKRKILVLASYIASLFFILGCFLVLELMDRTIRNKQRALSLTGAEVIGAYPGTPTLKYRAFALETNRIATAHICNRIAPYFSNKRRTVVALISSDPMEGKSHLSNEMKSYWSDMGFKVSQLNHQTDFNSQSKTYLTAENVDILLTPEHSTSDLILLELPAMSVNMVPNGIMEALDVVIYVVKAGRAWRERDRSFLHILTEQASPKHVLLCLNKANRLAVEDFTGLLPPYSKRRLFEYKLLQMELTSDKSPDIDKGNTSNQTNDA